LTLRRAASKRRLQYFKMREFDIALARFRQHRDKRLDNFTEEEFQIPQNYSAFIAAWQELYHNDTEALIGLEAAANEQWRNLSSGAEMYGLAVNPAAEWAVENRGNLSWEIPRSIDIIKNFTGNINLNSQVNESDLHLRRDRNNVQRVKLSIAESANTVSASKIAIGSNDLTRIARVNIHNGSRGNGIASDININQGANLSVFSNFSKTGAGDIGIGRGVNSVSGAVVGVGAAAVGVKGDPPTMLKSAECLQKICYCPPIPPGLRESSWTF
jgi:hypothetical protein